MISHMIIFDTVKPFHSNICNYFFCLFKGLEQKGQPPSPTNSKAEQPEDLQDDAKGRWSDAVSELLISFAC